MVDSFCHMFLAAKNAENAKSRKSRKSKREVFELAERRGALFASSVSLKCGGGGLGASARSRSFVFCALDWRQYSFIQPVYPRQLSLVAYNTPLTPAKNELLTRRTPTRRSLRSACSLPYGSRTPARGGYPLPPEVPTRRNRVASSVFSVARQAAKSLPALPIDPYCRMLAVESKAAAIIANIRLTAVPTSHTLLRF